MLNVISMLNTNYLQNIQKKKGKRKSKLQKINYKQQQKAITEMMDKNTVRHIKKKQKCQK